MQTINYKCPNCGATLPYHGESGQMRCEYCDSEFDPEALRQYDEVLNQQAADSDQPIWEEYQNEGWQDESMGIFVCRSCGAEVVAEETTAATSCPYCGSTTVLSSRLTGVFKPDLVVPFAVGRDAAKQALQKFCKGKLLLSKSFLSETVIDKIAGMYVPFWLYDCDVSADINYRATRVHSYRSGEYQVTKTSHYLVRRAGDFSVQRLPVDGSQKMADAYMEAIEPYDYSKAVNFTSAYLSGYTADKYDVDAEASKPRANQRITASAQQLLRDTVIGYATVMPSGQRIDLHHGSIRYALMPVWLLNTTYRGKTYTFAMNGQTGKFVGNLPVSPARAVTLFGICAVAGGIIAALIALLGRFM